PEMRKAAVTRGPEPEMIGGTACSCLHGAFRAPAARARRHRIIPIPPRERQAMTYPNTQLFINGQWQDAADGRTLAVFNPSTGKEIGRVAHAGKADLDRALEAAQKG